VFYRYTCTELLNENPASLRLHALPDPTVQPTRKDWMAVLQENRSTPLDSPSWLWTGGVQLVGSHEQGYLNH